MLRTMSDVMFVMFGAYNKFTVLKCCHTNYKPKVPTIKINLYIMYIKMFVYD